MFCVLYSDKGTVEENREGNLVPQKKAKLAPLPCNSTEATARGFTGKDRRRNESNRIEEIKRLSFRLSVEHDYDESEIVERGESKATFGFVTKF